MSSGEGGEQRLLFRNAMAHLAAAANIVTSDGPAGRVGFSATAVCSVTDSPATLLVCLNRSASVYDAVRRNGRVCVNTLGSGHESLALLFGGKTPQDERFAAAAWSSTPDGSPVLDDALASFDGRITESSIVGSHEVLFVTIDRIRLNQPGVGGLIYFGRQFLTVG